jgi:DNA polymerase-1
MAEKKPISKKAADKKSPDKQKGESKLLVLLDTHAIIHRAYHALPDFASSKGEATGALYGLSTMLLSIVNELKPDYIVACYDLPEKTYRHEAYDAYKAGRKELDPELVSQLIRSKDLFVAFNIPLYSLAGFEADDMLGTIVEELKNDPTRIVIASGDMDTLQLVCGKKVQVFTLKKGIKDTVLYDEEGVKTRYGFEPLQLPDYKGLRGDPSDNIIGIQGIGEKTATVLVQKFGTIEGIYEALEKGAKATKAGKADGDKEFRDIKITERIIGLLRDGEEEARFSKMLATIRRDAPINFKLPELPWRESVDPEKILAFYKELEFRSLGEKIRQMFKISPAGYSASYSSDTPDMEKKSVDNSDDSDKPNKEDSRVSNSKKNNDESLFGPDIDPYEFKKAAVGAWVLNSNISDPTLQEILDEGKADTFEEAAANIANELKKQGLEKVYLEIEEPLISIVDRMEKRGVRIDKKYLNDLSKKYHKELEKIETQIYKLAGEEFNIGSPKQLGEILFDKLGLELKGLKKTAGGARSTKESELVKLKDMHAIIPLILQQRELSKLLSTYIDSIPDKLDSGGRLHARFRQAGTTTGRMSSIDPNLQNIPIKSELGRAIRHAFVADPGFVLASFDFSQIELRIAAILSDDKKLLDIFRSGQDVHRAVAAQVFKVTPEDVTNEMRRKAKVINFGILYGMGVNALKTNLGGTREEAQKFYAEYFATFTTLAEYLVNVKKFAAETGYTETFYGRRRYFEGINSKLPFIRASAERMAINAPIQGTQADLIKIAMRQIEEYIQKEHLADDVFLELQVHDELVYEIRKEKLKLVAEKIKSIMEQVMTEKETKGIPIVANAAAGENWGEMEKIN